MAWGVTADKLATILRDAWPGYAQWSGQLIPMGFEDILSARC